MRVLVFLWGLPRLEAYSGNCYVYLMVAKNERVLWVRCWRELDPLDF
jgi:hypothetical protein